MSGGKNTVLAWVDLETTGLKPVSHHRILEYAFVFTDLHLNELGAITDIVPQNMGDASCMMDEYVRGMHNKNGLLDELYQAELAAENIDYSSTILAAQDDILAKLGEVHAKASDHEVEVIFVIAGNTVGFDKGYLGFHMPKVFEALHYRQLDVSAYKVAFPDIFGTATSDAHRAMADIRESIESHRKMREIVEHGHDHVKMCDEMFAGQRKPTFDEDDGC